MLQYCDYIAAQAQRAIKADPEGMLAQTGPVKLDLHPEEGYFLSTNKTIEVTDCNGKRYRVTVEAVDA